MQRNALQKKPKQGYILHSIQNWTYALSISSRTFHMFIIAFIHSTGLQEQVSIYPRDILSTKRYRQHVAQQSPDVFPSIWYRND